MILFLFVLVLVFIILLQVVFPILLVLVSLSQILLKKYLLDTVQMLFNLFEIMIQLFITYFENFWIFDFIMQWSSEVSILPSFYFYHQAQNTNCFSFLIKVKSEAGNRCIKKWLFYFLKSMLKALLQTHSTSISCAKQILRMIFKTS